MMSILNGQEAGDKNISKPFSGAEPVARAIRNHQIELEDWPYAELAGELHRWVKIFDSAFKLKLPAYPVLQFRPLRRAYATYGWFRNGLGTRDNITFNSRKLGREPALVLGTLCHELVHLWQHYHGTPSSSRYHNVEFQKKALACGLVVDAWGCTGGYTEVFAFLLEKHGIKVDALTEVLGQLTVKMHEHGLAKSSVQRMKKWRCDCTTVRCATGLKAICQKCGCHFHRT